MKRAIREGVMNRNILQATNIQGLVDTKVNFNMRNLTIMRTLGFKETIPFSG